MFSKSYSTESVLYRIMMFCKFFFQRWDRSLRAHPLFSFVIVSRPCSPTERKLTLGVLRAMQTRSTTPSTGYVTTAHVHVARAGVYAWAGVEERKRRPAFRASWQKRRRSIGIFDILRRNVLLWLLRFSIARC